MICDQAQRQLSALLDGELSPQAQAGLREHLAACPACRAQWEELAALDQRLRRPLPSLHRSLGLAELLAGGGRPRPGAGDRLGAFFALVLGLGRPAAGRRTGLWAELGDAPPQLLGSAFLRLIGQAE